MNNTVTIASGHVTIASGRADWLTPTDDGRRNGRLVGHITRMGHSPTISSPYDRPLLLDRRDGADQPRQPSYGARHPASPYVSVQSIRIRPRRRRLLPVAARPALHDRRRRLDRSWRRDYAGHQRGYWHRGRHVRRCHPCCRALHHRRRRSGPPHSPALPRAARRRPVCSAWWEWDHTTLAERFADLLNVERFDREECSYASSAARQCIGIRATTYYL
jgi:hypothetical protein